MYPESIKIDFNNDRDEVLKLLSNNNPNDSNLNYNFLVSFSLFCLFFFFEVLTYDVMKMYFFLQYATKVIKFDRRGYKPRERILAVADNAIVIVEKTDKNQKIKDHLPIDYVTSLQMTSGMDNFLLIKVSERLEKSKVSNRSLFYVKLYIAIFISCQTLITRTRNRFKNRL